MEPATEAKSRVKEVRRSREQTRDQILDASVFLFAKQGFRSTTLKDVAKRSGANTALVSYYFGGKEGLFKAVLEKKLEEANRVFSPDLDLKEELSIEDLKAVLTRMFQSIREQELLHRIMVWSLVEGEDLSVRMTESLCQPLFDRFRALLKRSFVRHLPEEEMESRCFVLTGLIQNYAFMKWNFLPRLKTTQPSDTLLQEYERIIIEKMIQKIF